MKIEEYKFGSFRIDGKLYLDDIKIINNKVKYWQTRERHELKIEEIKDLLESRPDIIIIGTGASGGLQVSEDIKAVLTTKRITYFIEPTEKACKTFNELSAKGKRIAAIFHATC